MPTDIFDLYKPFRNRVREYHLGDTLYVVWAYSRLLQLSQPTFPRDIESPPRETTLGKPLRHLVFPWNLELLAKEAILNSGGTGKAKKDIKKWAGLALALNSAGKLDGAIAERTSNETNIMLELHRLAHLQFGWQAERPNLGLIARYFMIMRDSRLDEICRRKLGVSVADIYVGGLALYGHFTKSFNFTASQSGNGIDLLTDKFLAMACRSIEFMRVQLAKDQRYDEAFLYAYNSLRAFPLVSMIVNGQPTIVCPLPTLLLWRFTNGLYYELWDDPKFANPYGESFQSYVGEVLRRALQHGFHVIPEEKYGSTKSTERDSIDWIVADEKSALFIECKTKRMKWQAKTDLETTKTLQAQLDYLAKAIVQTYKNVHDYRLGKYGHFHFEAKRKIYPVIVTLEDWYLFGFKTPELLENIVRIRLAEADLPSSYLTEMPYTIWSAHDLESVVSIIDGAGIAAVMDGRLQSSEKRNWGWSGYLAGAFKDFKRRNLFSDEIQSLFDNSARRLTELRGIIGE